MKRILQVLLTLCAAMPAFAQTNVGGTVNSNTTWTAASSPYVVTSNITVNSGFTLTIESGVTVKFNDNIGMIVNGTVTADNVIFTASNASPSPGVTGDLRIGTTSGSISGTGTFSNCQFLYFKSVKLERGAGTFTSCSFSNFGLYGIESYGNGNLTVNGGSMSSIGKSGDYNMFRFYGSSTNSVSNFTLTGDNNSSEVYIYGAATGTFNSVTVQNSTGDAMYLATTGAVSLTSCNFNNTRYPIQVAQTGVPLTFAGTNSFVNNTYDAVYCPVTSFTTNTTLNNPGIPYVFSSNVAVETGQTLTIASGTIVKMQPSTSFTIKGKLTAEALVGEKIYFTSVYDDNLGGDTNNDANNTAPVNGKFYGVDFTNSSDDASVLRRVDIRWTTSSGAVSLANASPTIDNCTFSNCYYGAAFNADSNPTFTNNTIAASQSTPVAMSFEADPIFTNNAFSTSDNVYDAIGLLGGTLTANATIVKRNFTDVPNVTYVMLNDVTIPAAFTLTIDPGVVIKGESGYDFIVNGKLLVNGSASEKVVFTSVHDDNFGNPLDTKNDGTTQVPSIGNMGGFYFSETSSALSKIDHSNIRFANYTANYQSISLPTFGQIYYYYDAAIAVNNSSPTISNSQIVSCNNAFDIRGLASPVISENSIVNTQSPYRIAVQATPDIQTNTYSSLGYKAIVVLPEVINYTATLPKRNIAGLFDNITYVVPGFYVNAGAMVTFEDGLNVKMLAGANINVFGGFKVAGTAESRVLFTVIADDNAGASSNPIDNDTQGNGNATTPDTQKWGSIFYLASSDDAFSSISYADFFYGGSSYAPIMWRSASANLDHVNVKFSYNYGLWFEQESSPAVDQVFIQSSRLDPLAMSYFANPNFTNITFDANGSNGIRLIDTQLNANATLYQRNIAGITNIAYVNDGLTVKSGATLTINPGVVMKFSSGTHTLWVEEGAIVAQGTSSEKIIFTSIKDDSRGGDTNNNGNADPPASGNWGGVYTKTSSMQSIFDYCEFRYGSNADYYYFYSANRMGMIVSENNNLVVNNSVIQFVNAQAFGIYGTSSATITNNSLQNIAAEPVAMSMFSTPTFDANTLENVALIAIRIIPETYTQSATFPFRSFGGHTNITYTIDRSLGISSGTTITIPAGMHFKGYSSYNKFDINGNLHVAGTEGNPVVFTAIDDDAYGRPTDTQGNGAPAPNSISKTSPWFNFNNISDDASIIEYAIIRYVGQAIKLSSASPTIRNNIFESNDFAIVAEGISEEVIENNTFHNLTYAPFTTSLVAFPASTTGNTMTGTTWKAIYINTETLTQDITLPKRAFGGINNIPYVSGNYTVGPGVKLTIDAGVIWKFYSGYLNVTGALYAVGGELATQKIIITDIDDDFYGGDTNAAFVTQYYSHFGGIVFRNESSDAQSRLENVIVRQAYNAPGVKLESASPTLVACSFRENGYYGLHLTGASNPDLADNDFLGNGATNSSFTHGVYNEGSFTIDATGSWWGHNSGPYHPTLNATGTGSKVSDNVLFDPWATDLSLNPITGDVSLNGMINSYDAALVLQASAALLTLNARQLISADVSGLTGVTAMDASLILQYSAGLIKYFPAEAENKRTKEQFPSGYSNINATLQDGELSSLDQIVEIPLTLENVNELFALELNIALDEELELVELVKGDLLNYVSYYDEASKILHLAFAQSTSINRNGTLGMLRVKVATPVVSKNELAITITKAMGNETNVMTNAKSAKVTLSNSLQGEMATTYKVYPNPAMDYIDVALKPSYEGNVELSMLDATGKSVGYQSFVKEKGMNTKRLNFTAEKGIYLLKIKTSEGLVTSKVVVGK